MKKLLFPLLFLGILFISLSSCGSDAEPTSEAMTSEPVYQKPAISFVPSGRAKGRQTQMYTLTNGHGISINISNYGGIITSIKAPDKNGMPEEITLGFDSLNQYLGETPYFGALIGRYGNRIAKGKFTLDGKTYTLATNNMGNHLHGGMEGFDKVIWQASVVEKTDGVPGLRLEYSSADMEEGYPGKLDVTVIYSLNNDNELTIEYEAETDKPTVVNLTNHTYFNLTGNARRDILGHKVRINANRFLPVDETLIPTGELQPVEGTPFDFTESTEIGARIDADDEQIKRGLGYDHCWVLNRPRNAEAPSLAAVVEEPTSGRTLEVYTTEPAVQFYSGNFLDGTLTGIGGVVYKQRYGLCLETEHFPDSPNQSNFPTTTLKPGETYSTTTIYKFGVAE
ncbi:MAG: aldose epimerase family protein [Saprospiraceae bacterium]